MVLKLGSTSAFKKLLEGNRSEKFINPDQKLLVFADDEELQAALEAAKREAQQEVEKITYTRNKHKKEAKPRSDSFPAHLRREETVKPLSDEDQKLADSGHEVIRQLIHEVLRYKRAELFVEAHYQWMLKESEEGPAKEIVEKLRDEIPASLGEKGRYDASVAVAVACGKFELHIPYYRLQDIFASSGWAPSRSTLDYMLDLLGEAVQELPVLMTRQLRLSHCIGMDDTGVTLIMPKEIPVVVEGDLRTQRLLEKMLEAKKGGKTSLDAKMWAYSGGEDQPYDIFDFRVSRHRDGPAELLSGYGGHVMADCYSGNLSVVLNSKSSMTRMACWAHPRRKIFEARDNDRTASALPLALIGQLYDIERLASDWPNEKRTAIRQSESRLILDRLRTWLDGIVAKSILPASKLGQAVQYIRNHWDALCVYTNDGRLPVDNNWVERLMKKVTTDCLCKLRLFAGVVSNYIGNSRSASACGAS